MTFLSDFYLPMTLHGTDHLTREHIERKAAEMAAKKAAEKTDKKIDKLEKDVAGVNIEKAEMSCCQQDVN